MNASGPATSPTRSQRPADRRHVGEARHDDQQPHRREDRRALELAARMVGAHPEDVDADDDADRRQHAREVGEDAVGIGAVPRPRTPAPGAVGRQRPHADSANTSTIASSSVSIARNASSTAVIGLPTPVAAMLAAVCGASVGAGSGSVSTHSASVAVTAAAPSGGDDARRAPGPLGARGGFGAAQARRRADQQRAGQAAADRGFGQRHVDAVQLHPGQRQQQAIGDEADDRGERVAREHRPERQRRGSAPRGRR